LGGLFGVSKDAVLRYDGRAVAVARSVGHHRPDGRPVRTAGDLEAQLAKLTVDQRAALVDGTFVPVGRPAGWDAQKPFSSNHHDRRTRNFTALTDDRADLLWAGGGCPGATHDLTALADGAAAVPPRRSTRAEMINSGHESRLSRVGCITYAGRRPR
jgi:hypothetical protein